MKTNKFLNNIYLGCALMGASLLASCEDYLTLLPTDSIPEENFWETKGDVDNVRAAAYLQARSKAITDRIIYWGEVRCDNVELNKMNESDLKYVMDGVLQPTNGYFNWSSFYVGINYCNKVLENGQRMIDKNIDATFSPGEWKPIKAEMLSLRALYYFYLVRAFRDVPYVSHTISTDKEALDARKGQPAMQGVVLLDTLIRQLEDCKEYAAKNYGNALDNKGRFTKRSVRMLLADMYLWQGCMLQNGIAKGYVICNENGDTIKAQGELNTLATAKFTRATELCDEVLAEMREDYDKEIKLSPNSFTEIEKTQPYPMVRIAKTGSYGVTDLVYASLWGSGHNGDESILELQNDGIKNTAETLVTMYYSSSGGTPFLVAKPSLFTSVTNVDKDGAMKGFGKTDIRIHENVNFTSVMQSNYPIRKNIYTSVSLPNLEDMAFSLNGNSTSTTTTDVNPTRSNGSQDANWPVYRLSDLMMIKAECLARLDLGGKNTPELKEGFQLVNELFKRYNPGLDSTGSSALSTSDRLLYNYANDRTGQQLLELVYRERQREFFSEGKRWFDLVRQAESVNKTEDVLGGWMGASKSIQTRLRKLVALYNPYFNDELKVNPALVQNEVWDKYTPNSSKPTDNKK